MNSIQRFLPRFERTAAMATMLAAIMSCASGGTSQAPAGQSAPATGASGNAAPTKSSPSVLIADDLQKAEAQNLGDAIQRLRPEWLRRSNTRATNTMGGLRAASEGLVIWVDNNRAGGVEILTQMQITNVRSVRYFTPSEAQSRFGNGNTGGAIQVVTMTGSKP